MYKKFIHIFVLSCKKATFLTEKKLHTSLSPIEEWQLKTHLSLCPYCTAYTHKAIFLDKLMLDDRISEQINNHFSEKEVDDLKERVKSAIREP